MPMLRVMMAGAAGMLGGCGMMTGCTPTDLSGLLDAAPTGLAADAAKKAEQVAREIGGIGFGGPMMNGYFDHMDDHMGFHDATDLADHNGTISVTFTNDSGRACTFQYVFMRSADGLDTQTRDVEVPAGGSLTIEMPCAETVGMGSLTEVGAPGGSADDGASFDNRYCVPGFLNSDYACGGGFACTLAPDTNDVDHDGDTTELIIVTSGMQQHMGSGGMGRHGVSGTSFVGGLIGAGMMNSSQ